MGYVLAWKDRPTMRYEIFGYCPEKGQWRWEKTRASKATRNYEKFLSEYADKMSIDDYYIEHLMATNEKLDFVRMNERVRSSIMSHHNQETIERQLDGHSFVWLICWI